MLTSDSIFQRSDNFKFSLIPDKNWEQGKCVKALVSPNLILITNLNVLNHPTFKYAC